MPSRELTARGYDLCSLETYILLIVKVPYCLIYFHILVLFLNYHANTPSQHPSPESTCALRLFQSVLSNDTINAKDNWWEAGLCYRVVLRSVLRITWQEWCLQLNKQPTDEVQTSFWFAYFCEFCTRYITCGVISTNTEYLYIIFTVFFRNFTENSSYKEFDICQRI